MLGIHHSSSKRFLLIAEHESGFEITRAQVVPQRKIIRITSSSLISDTKKFFHPLKIGETIIVALGSAHATTIETIVSLKRDNPSTLITESEMDHLMFKGLWEFLHQHRAWAAKKMGISDLSLVLASIEIKDVMLGNHHVFNPIGFKGAVIAIRLRGTFIARELLPSLERMKSWGDLQIVEEGVALADAVPHDECCVVCVDKKTTSVFWKGREEIRHVEEYPWGTELFTRAIGESFGLDYETAAGVLAYVSAHGASPSVARRCGQALKAQYEALYDLVDSKSLKKKVNRSHPVFVFHFKDMPMSGLLADTMKNERIRIDERLEREEYIMEKRKNIGFDPAKSQTTLALFLYTEHAPKYDFLNQLLLRRARWLIPHFSLQ